MDDRLKQALDFSNYMITLGNQKRILTEQFQNDLIHYYNGGQFTVTQQLLSFCQSLISLNQTDTILIDDNNTPIIVDNLEKFTDTIVSVYWKAANRYLTEYNKLKTNRTVEGIIDL
tara:strand:+ start:194 stop:541 length:348 start_codon:yes stop_codon:yes gene_type:complete